MSVALPTPKWMKATLITAAIYNAAFGIVAGFAPQRSLHWLGFVNSSAREQALWQCIAMVVGVYGIAYFLAAADPRRHWPVVFAGLLGKLLGPIGFVTSAAKGILPWRMGAVILTNDLIWWIPFGLILLAAYRARQIQP